MITQDAQRDTDGRPAVANGTAPAAGDLARLADELLHEVQVLRRQYEDLNTRLADAASDEPGQADRRPLGPDSQESLHTVALQMAFAGRSREQAKAELRELGAPDGDAIVDEVYGRTDTGRMQPRRRRLFARRNR